jgi:hypothetical protein
MKFTRRIEALDVGVLQTRLDQDGRVTAPARRFIGLLDAAGAAPRTADRVRSARDDRHGVARADELVTTPRPTGFESSLPNCVRIIALQPAYFVPSSPVCRYASSSSQWF